MICAIYRSSKKEGMYLYIEKREQFDAVPKALLRTFGKPQFSMLFNLKGDKQLKIAPNQKVLEAIKEQGFYLQAPPLPESLLNTEY
ncbi:MULTISPECIES: YcgL domain-containing protein [Pasteurellaceae]|uniref:YcgL domain-containing protein QJU78_09705 n=1 Tax=Pasteurella atlantica TaxID=2827233 RepID=A0AAW8CRZ2_9PAST|nr:YcgL domain-containing protein [Pasteurella atlantica]MBR0574488.1 YcgL domain-containing protein [Pasteurella atlantica]MDP8040373.1 YcgL domain-containing protein [Pasteurella atlantica]MDP8042424.1 YcgL domain-containing protein [Pasteurella atlantica]MDP8044643.1 YcgL domain-containing protein [Pasteurella atlantica]MDP8046674.1 YcgL domain-containing protein [Pasteurella atlantica]